LNVALDTGGSEEIAALATSINAAAGQEVSRETLLRQLLLDLDATYLQLRQGRSPVPEWRGLLDTIGQRVDAVSGGETYAGLAEGVDDTGNLLLRKDDGELLTLTAGDVSLSR
jgi:BirA family biotin operon repressor/biotin-[acetyl-CoA-carboxylase] ligase